VVVVAIDTGEKHEKTDSDGEMITGLSAALQTERQ
jgi:hypothetical protein